MKRLLGLCALLLVAAVPAYAQKEASEVVKKAPLTAEAILKRAYVQAKAEKKAVFVHFTASWCGWCKKLEASMKTPLWKKLIEDNYVVVELDVMESPDKKQALENPGADKYLSAWGGAKSGIPYMVFLDADGKKLADSNVMPGGQNIGFPSEPEEVMAFDKLLKQTAPRLSESDRGRLIATLQKPSK